MTRPSLRTVLPLAVATGTGMLAMDLFLPAVPVLQQSLGTDVSRAQATVSVFLIGLAASQLLWGEAAARIGPRRCVQAGLLGLALASAACALAPSIEWLLAARLLQGLAAGAAAVVAPAVVRATLGPQDAVRGIATIASVEAIVPAAGPLLGSALLAVVDWRVTFWVVAAVALVGLPWALRAAPHRLPGADAGEALGLWQGHAALLRHRRFRRLALSHALCIGALLTFVGSAPQLMTHAYGLDATAFAGLQVAGVSGFITFALVSGRISRRIGPARAVRGGAIAHLVLVGALLAAAWADALPYAMLAGGWCVFCAIVAVRGPAAFSEALDVPPAQMGRASAQLVLALLVAGAIGTQLVAPAMDGPSAVPLLAAMLLLVAGSLLAVTPYPATPAGPAAPAAIGHPR